jgi:hypothetical protein
VPNILTSVPTKKVKQPLSVTHPELAKEADGWDPSLLSSDSGVRVQWKCLNVHTWTTAINYRVQRRSKCPYCVNQKVWIGFNDFATTHPELLAELVSSDGKDFVGGSFARDLEWRCPKGHIYVSKPAYRTIKKRGCPVCAGKIVVAGSNDLATTHPHLAVEAYQFDPTTVTAGSGVLVEWKCSKGHIFKARPHQRTGLNSGCAVCNGNQINIGVNDLASTDPELALEAHNWDPKTLTRSSSKRRDWKCKFGHIWSAAPNSRTNMNSGCPVCSGRGLLSGFNDLLTLFPAIAAQADGWDPSLVLAGTHKKYKWKCAEGHKWSSVVKDRTLRGDGCPSCAVNGFNPTADGYLYFITQPVWEMFQIGITNYPDDRLHSHGLLGWDLLELRGPMDGHLTQQWETAILRMLKAKGADLSNSKIAGKFDGYSEAWSKSTFEVSSIKELMRLTDEFEN